MLEKIKKISYKAILIILLILMVYVTYCSIYKIYNKVENLKPFVIILGVVVMTMFFVTLNKKMRNITEKQAKLLAIIICILFFLGMTIFGIKFKSMPQYDLSNLIAEAKLMLENGGVIQTKYCAKYPQQIPLMILIFYISKLGEILNIPNIMIIANSMFMAITAYFLFLTVKKIKGGVYSFSLISLIFFVLNPIFYIYSSYYYTDTMCMPFAMGAIYLFVCAIQSNKYKKKIILSILAGVLLSFGFEIRAVIGIVLIGIIVGEFFEKREIREKCVVIMCIILGFLIGIFSYKLIAKDFEKIKDSSLEFPITHYVMMALNSNADGKYSGEDEYYTRHAGNYNEKVNANIDKIESRLKEMGIPGVLKLSKKKLAVNWSNGTYEYIPKFYDVEEVNNIYEFLVGNKKIFCMYFLQICKAFLYVMLIIAILSEIKSAKDHKFIYISIFGFFMFYMIWEVNCRYSLSCLPLMMLLLPIGIEKISKALEVKSIQINAEKVYKIDMRKVMKYISLTLVIVIAILLIMGFYKYCIQKKIYYDKVAMQLNAYNTMDDIANNKIEQEFIAREKFNSVSIKFTKKENLKNNKYYLCILDEQGNELVKKEFYSNSIKNNKFYTFNFNYIEPNGNTKYKIKIYAENTSEEYTILGVRFYQSSEYDIYPAGKLFVNDKESVGDIVFKVENKLERSYLSKVLYIVMSGFIMCVVLYSFYPYMKKVSSTES